MPPKRRLPTSRSVLMSSRYKEWKEQLQEHGSREAVNESKEDSISVDDDIQIQRELQRVEKEFSKRNFASELLLEKLLPRASWNELFGISVVQVFRVKKKCLPNQGGSMENSSFSWIYRSKYNWYNFSGDSS